MSAFRIVSWISRYWYVIWFIIFHERNELHSGILFKDLHLTTGLDLASCKIFQWHLKKVFVEYPNFVLNFHFSNLNFLFYWHTIWLVCCALATFQRSRLEEPFKYLESICRVPGKFFRGLWENLWSKKGGFVKIFLSMTAIVSFISFLVLEWKVF